MRKVNLFINFFCLMIVLTIGLFACGNTKTTGDTTNGDTTTNDTTTNDITTSDTTTNGDTTTNDTTTEVVPCDHTKMHHTSINFSDYDMCSGEVYFDTCDCGEKVFIPLSLFEPGCDSNSGFDEDYTDDNGVLWTKQTLVCDECKASFTMNITDIVEGCLVKSIAYITIVKDGNVILDNAYGEYVYENHNYQREELNLSEYAVCGESVEIFKCGDCGEILNFGSLSCAIDGPNIEEMEPETFVDENGLTHSVYKLQCPDCGLVEAIELWDEPYSQCVGKRTMSATLSKGETVILSISYSDYYIEHEFEYSYELYGDDCEDGYLENALCKTCGIIYSSENDWHEYEELGIDLSEYNVCGNSSIYYDYCKICNQVLYFDDSECMSNCSSPESITNYTKDGIEHTVYDYLCSECGLKITYDDWEEETSECLTKIISNITVSINGNIIFNDTITERNYHHNYTYEYDLRGEVCTDGYQIIKTCSVCGVVDYDYTNGHSFKNYEINMNEKYGGCNCMIYVSECEICHQRSMIYSCYCEMSEPVTTANTDDSGIEHTINTYSCSTCQLVIVKDNWIVEGENCLQTEYEKTSIYYDGQLIEENVDSYSETVHDFQYSYRMTGTTCQEGYIINITCSKCDYSDTRYGSDHDYVQHTIQLGELGCCEGYLQYFECKVCGKNSAISGDFTCNFTDTNEDYTDDNGVYHTVIVKTCTCGFKHITERYTIAKEDCQETNYQIDSYMIGEQEIASYTDERDGYNHAYATSYQIEEGKTCKDGYTVIETCTKCGATESRQSTEHVKVTNEIDLGELGCCGCVITEKRCVVCDKVTYLNYTCECQTNLDTKIEPDENGIEHTINTYTCGDCKLLIVMNTWNVYVNECQYYNYYTVKIYYDDKLITERMQEAFVTQHTSEKTYVLHGETCEDGYTIISKCKYCGVTTETSEGTDHLYEDFDNIDLSKYEGCCGGSIYVDLCWICKNFAFDLTYCKCSFVDGGSSEVDGHTFSTLLCNTCNFKIVYECWQETNEDKIAVNHSVVYFYNKDDEVYKIQN